MGYFLRNGNCLCCYVSLVCYEYFLTILFRLLERRARLAGVDDKTDIKNEILVSLEDISDAVFEFKLAEIVLNQGQDAVDNKIGAFLRILCRIVL